MSSGRRTLRGRLSSVFRRDSQSLFVPPQPTQRSVTPETLRRTGKIDEEVEEVRIAMGPLDAAIAMEEQSLFDADSGIQDTDIDMALPAPSSNHASRGADLLAALSGLSDSWRSAKPVAVDSPETTLRV